MLAHGAVLLKNGFSQDQLEAIVRNYHNAGLEPAEIVMMDFVQKMIREAHQISQADVERLREQELSDEDILDVVLAAAARSFYSKALDALGAEPDEAYSQLETRLRATFNTWK